MANLINDVISISVFRHLAVRYDLAYVTEDVTSDKINTQRSTMLMVYHGHEA